MNLKRAIDIKWAILLILAFVGVWLGVYYGWGKWGNEAPPPINRAERKIGVICTNMNCQAHDVITLQQFDLLERNDVGMVKCPVCGEYTYGIDRHYQPEANPEPTP